MSELLYKELSYKIVGSLFEVYNSLGYGHRERVYQSALAEEFKLNGINFEKELYFPIIFKEKLVSKYFFDFLIDNKIVLEVKVSNEIFQKDINQILAYLKVKNYRLGKIVAFTSEGIKYKRILN